MFTSAVALGDGPPNANFRWNRMPRQCETSKTFGDPIVAGSADLFSAKWDDDVVISTPQGPFVLTRTYAGARNALGQTTSTALTKVCREGVVGAPWPGLLKSPYGQNLIRQDDDVQRQPLTLNSLTSIVDTNCETHTRVLTTEGDTRFFAPIPTLSNGQTAWVERAPEATAEPSRLKVNRSWAGALSFEWLHEDGRRFVYEGIYPATGPNGQYRLRSEYKNDGRLFYEVFYGYPLDNTAATTLWDGGVKKYFSDPISPIANPDGGACEDGLSHCSGTPARCVDTRWHSQNCGSCGNPCGPTQYCGAGVCRQIPPPCQASVEPHWVSFPGTDWTLRFEYRNPPSVAAGGNENPTSECVLTRVYAKTEFNEETLVEYNYETIASLDFAYVSLSEAVFSSDAGANAWKKMQPTLSGRSWKIGVTENRPNRFQQDLHESGNTEHVVTHARPTESPSDVWMNLHQERNPSDTTASFVARLDIDNACVNCCQAEAIGRRVEMAIANTLIASEVLSFYQDQRAVEPDGGISDWNSDFDALAVARRKLCASTSSLYCQNTTETYHYGRAGSGFTPPEMDVCSISNRPVVLLAQGLTNGGYDQRDVRMNTSQSTLELRAVSSGASSPTASDALRSSRMMYNYGTQLQQFVEQSREQSVLVDNSSAETTVVRVNDQVFSIVRSGFTMINGSIDRRHIATFYLHAHACTADRIDDDGLIRTIVGPCEVSDESATLCSQNVFNGGGVTVTQSIPITELFYYAADDLPLGVTESKTDAFNSGRVAVVRRFTNGCSASLDTIFGSYSALGSPGKVTGPNGETSEFTWKGALLTHALFPDSSEYGFEWDRGRITKVTRPEGDSTMYCTQTHWPIERDPHCVLNDSSFGQYPGVKLNRELAWIADVARPPEKRTVRLQQFARNDREELVGHQLVGPFNNISPLGEVSWEWSECNSVNGGDVCMTRSSVSNDFQRNPVLSAQGFSNEGARTSIRYDPSGLVRAIGSGLDFTQSTDPVESYCKTGGNDDPRCTYFSRDRLDRLVGTQWPAGEQEDCLAYDAQGNISVVARGCYNDQGVGGSICPANSITTAYDGLSVNGGPTCGERIEYIWDDFGRLVAMNRPAGSGTSRTTYEYNPSGQLVKRQTTTQADAGEVSWTKRDSLGRVVESSVSKNGDTLELTTKQWDSAPSAPGGCLSSFPSSPNQKGHVAYTTDPVWNTWYAYDLMGRVVAERRVDADATTCAGGGDGNVQAKYNTTRYEYTPNGNLSLMIYPSGRIVRYDYDDEGGEVDNNLPTGITMSFFDTENTYWMWPIVSGIEWTADKRLKKYFFSNYAFSTSFDASAFTVVEFDYSSEGSGERPTSCSQKSGGNDGTGRLRRMRVTDLLSKDLLYERWYTWKADQVAAIDVCYRNQQDPLNEFNALETTGFDALKRLKKNAVLPLANETSRWNITGREYSYDLLGNRTFEEVFDPTTNWTGLNGWLSTYAAGSQLVRREAASGSAPGTPMAIPGAETTYEYDADGRQIRRNAGLNGSSVPNASVSYGFPASATHTGGGIGEALRTVELNGDDSHFYSGLFFNYFYDVDNKRIRKEYPEGTKEDFFYDLQKHLIAEKSVASAANSEMLVWDEYIYLRGIPVAAMRSAVDAREGWYGRLPDIEGFNNGACPRLDTWGHCGLTQLVSDYQSRPVLAIDNNNSITGVGEYDAFGFRNRVSLPATQVVQGVDVENLGKLPVGGLNSDFRLRVGFVDAPHTSFPSAPGIVEVHDSSGMLSYAAGAYPSIVSGWHTGTDFTAVFNPQSSTTGSGAVLQGFDYERRDSGRRYFPPLRFPGQYYDEETDLHENWNRFYDPATGGYTTVEPLLQLSWYVRQMALRGMSVPPYAYALSNPVQFADPTGFGAVNVSGPGWFGDAVSSYLASPAGAAVSATIAASPLDVNISMASLDQRYGPDFGATTPNSTATPTSVNVIVDAVAIADYKSGAYKSYKPKSYHNVSEVIAHELGHANAIMKYLASIKTLPQHWWPTLNPKTNSSACEAGRRYREGQGWDPLGHDELTRDCVGCGFIPVSVPR